jgi:ribonucleotide monophosphatase NagD (HAD superfamily)
VWDGQVESSFLVGAVEGTLGRGPPLRRHLPLRFGRRHLGRREGPPRSEGVLGVTPRPEQSRFFPPYNSFPFLFVVLLIRCFMAAIFISNNSTKSRHFLIDRFAKFGITVPKSHVYTSSYAAAAYLKDKNFHSKVYVLGGSGIQQELEEEGSLRTLQSIHQCETLFCFQESLQSVVKRMILSLRKTSEMCSMPNTTSKLVRTLWNCSFLFPLSLRSHEGAVVTGLDVNLNYGRLAAAHIHITRGALFIATNADVNFPYGSEGHERMLLPGAGAILAALG